jgi:ribosomal protein L11 methyltransferase
MASHIAHGGTAILSGLLVTQADSILAAYAEVGFLQLEREDIGEWTALVLRKA